MIEQEAPDIVAIATGTEFHYPLAMGVLEPYHEWLEAEDRRLAG